MKPFNLERALSGDKVVTRNGCEVTQLTKFKAANSRYCLMGVFDEQIESWGDCGKFYDNSEDHPFDLFMREEEKKPVVRWLWAIKFNWGPTAIIGSNFAENEKDAIKGYRCVESVTRLEWSRTEFPE